MTRFILRRLVQAVLTLFGITILTFTLVRLAPGDPVSLMVAGTAEMTAADLAAMRAAYGVDEPIPQQYLRWLGRLAQGDLGQSLLYKRPVTRRLPVSRRFPLSPRSPHCLPDRSEERAEWRDLALTVRGA